MKILFITPAYWPAIDYGGPIPAIKLLAEEYQKLGHNVSVFTTAYGLKENKLQKEIVNGVEVYYFKFFKFFRWVVPVGFLMELLKAKDKFDVFHLNLVWDPTSWLFGFILALFNKKIIITTHGTFEEELIKKRSHLVKKIIYFLFIRFIFKKAKGFHFTSETEKNKFFEIFKKEKPFCIIPNLFDFSEFQKIVDKSILKKFNLFDKKYVLYFGRINWKKRIELLIDVFFEISKKYKDTYLAICGSADKDYFEKIEKQIKALGLEDKIILNGQTIYGEEKIALFQNALCFVLPSISENFGYVVLETLASGIPVIISSGVGLKELTQKYNASLVFDGKNDKELKNDLINKLELILNDEKLRKNLIENGFRLLKEEFNNQILAQKMIEFYNKI